ncbi:HIT family protein [Rhodohalobacter halophilus]|uniref:HIT family protein n=1 Tax=Rhodohalobacter halophilus TaxID=1812810 RepID=UPI00083F63F5|nr:HIT family protein [Rhodohalobacter halophilus]
MATIFTKIINGEIPCHKIAENESHIAFLDINPIAEGHTLVVPKKEIDYVFDLPDDLLGETMVFAKKVAAGLDNAVKPIRTGVIVEGLEVPHAHIHLVPIYKESQEVSLKRKVNVSEKRMKELAELISKTVEI